MKQFFRSPPGLVVLALLAVGGTAAMLTGIPDLKVDNDVRTLIPPDHPILHWCDEVDEVFGAADAIVVALDGGEGLTPALITLTRDLTDALSERYDDVLSVTSTDTIEVRGTTLTPVPLVEDGPVDAGTITRLVERLDAWPVYKGMVVSDDGRVPAILLKVRMSIPVEEKDALLVDVRRIVDERVAASGLDVRVVIAGEPVLTTEIGNRIHHDLGDLSPLALAVVIFMLLITLRSVGGVVGPTLTVVLGVAATFGLMGLAKRPVMTVTSAIPVFMVAIGSAYGIHIVSHFRQALGPGVRRRDAVAKALESVGGAVLVAAVTTMAGFLSLGVSEVVPVRDFGIFLSFGVGMALLASLGLVPLVLLIGRPGRAASPVGGASGPDSRDGLLARFLAALAGGSARRRWIVAALALALAGGMTASAAVWLRVDVDSVSLFPEDSEMWQADHYFGERFGGTHTLSVVVNGPGPRSMLEPAALEFLAQLQARLEEEPEVGKTVSMADFIRRMHQVMSRDDPAMYRIPDDRRRVADYIQLYEMSGDPEDFSDVVDFDYATAHLLVQSKTGAATAARRLSDIVEAFAAAQLPPGYDLALAGTMIRYEVVNDYVVQGQLVSLGISLVLVFLMVGGLFVSRGASWPAGRNLARAVSAGALTLVPILVAVAMNFGIMALVDVPLDIGTVLIAACAVGIGIDYSVHFLLRYEDERTGGLATEAAIRAAARATGRPILFNALAVSAGFLTLMGSDFLSLQSLAWLTALTMVVTSFAALTLIPAGLRFRDGP
ncbi:MAG: MMPL family transporter [Pseudomonadota bacterium]